MDPEDRTVFITEEISVEEEIISEEGTSNTSDLSTIDSIIMDNFHEGLIYFSDCLDKYNQSLLRNS